LKLKLWITFQKKYGLKQILTLIIGKHEIFTERLFKRIVGIFNGVTVNCKTASGVLFPI
jgi:hypothetical protein